MSELVRVRKLGRRIKEENKHNKPYCLKTSKPMDQLLQRGLCVDE